MTILAPAPSLLTSLVDPYISIKPILKLTLNGENFKYTLVSYSQTPILAVYIHGYLAGSLSENISAYNLIRKN